MQGRAARGSRMSPRIRLVRAIAGLDTFPERRLADSITCSGYRSIAAVSAALRLRPAGGQGAGWKGRSRAGVVRACVGMLVGLVYVVSGLREFPTFDLLC